MWRPGQFRSRGPAPAAPDEQVSCGVLRESQSPRMCGTWGVLGLRGTKAPSAGNRAERARVRCDDGPVDRGPQGSAPRGHRAVWGRWLRAAASQRSARPGPVRLPGQTCPRSGRAALTRPGSAWPLSVGCAALRVRHVDRPGVSRGVVYAGTGRPQVRSGVFRELSPAVSPYLFICLFISDCLVFSSLVCMIFFVWSGNEPY